MVGLSQKEELGLWYLSKAYSQSNEALRYFSLFRYPDSVICAYESIEFSLKAMCKLLDVEYKKDHFLDAATLVKLAEKIDKKGLDKKGELLSALPIILGYTGELRSISRYGIDEGGVSPVSPEVIFRKDHCDKVLNDAARICELLYRVDMAFRWRRGKW